jgi:multiple antibiotic resistance protein
MYEFLLQAFVILLVIVNPFAVVPVFVSLTQGDSLAIKKKVAQKACLISVSLLLVFSFIGDKLLDLMRISPEAFRITGGLLLLLAAIEMVMSKGSAAQSNASGGQTYEDISVFPLAIPLLAGPGSLTSVVLLMREAQEMHFQVPIGLIAVVLIVTVVTYLSLMIGDRLVRMLGSTGSNVLTRVFGIIIAAVSIDCIIKGVVSVCKSIG